MPLRSPGGCIANQKVKWIHGPGRRTRQVMFSRHIFPSKQICQKTERELRNLFPGCRTRAEGTRESFPRFHEEGRITVLYCEAFIPFTPSCKGRQHGRMHRPVRAGPGGPWLHTQASLPTSCVTLETLFDFSGLCFFTCEMFHVTQAL